MVMKRPGVPWTTLLGPRWGGGRREEGAPRQDCCDCTGARTEPVKAKHQAWLFPLVLWAPEAQGPHL